MGWLSSIFGGGDTTSVSTSTSNVNVTVNPQIANVIDTAPLAQPIERLTAALADAGQSAVAAQAIGAAISEQGAAARQSALLSTVKDYGALALAVIAGIFLLKRGKA